MKKKSAKKCISFFMVLLLCASFLPMCVFAAETGRDAEQSDIQMMTQGEVAEPDVVLTASEEVIQEEIREESNDIPVKIEGVSDEEKVSEQLPAEERTQVDTNVDILNLTPATEGTPENRGNEISEESEASDVETVHSWIPDRPNAETVIPSQEPEEVSVAEEPSSSNEWDENWSFWNFREWKSIEFAINKTYQLICPWGWVYQSKTSWTSSDNDVATVDQTGLVTLHSTGDVCIRVKYSGFILTYTHTYYLHVFSRNVNPGSGSEEPIVEPADPVVDEPKPGSEEPTVKPTDPVVDEPKPGSEEPTVEPENPAVNKPGTDGEYEGKSDTVTIVPVDGDSGSDVGGLGDGNQRTGSGNQISVDQTDIAKEDTVTTNSVKTDPRKSETVQNVVTEEQKDIKSTDAAVSTKVSSQVQTVTSTEASSDERTVSGNRSQSTGSVATQNNTEVTPEGETAAVPEDVIDEPSVPTAAYVNPAGDGGGILPGRDTMAAHAGAVAGMLIAVAAGGAVGMVKAYKVKKYEADV